VGGLLGLPSGSGIESQSSRQALSGKCSTGGLVSPHPLAIDDEVGDPQLAGLRRQEFGRSRVLVDIDRLVINPLFIEELAGPVAIGAPGGGVEENFSGQFFSLQVARVY